MLLLCLKLSLYPGYCPVAMDVQYVFLVLSFTFKTTVDYMLRNVSIIIIGYLLKYCYFGEIFICFSLLKLNWNRQIHGNT